MGFLDWLFGNDKKEHQHVTKTNKESGVTIDIRDFMNKYRSDIPKPLYVRLMKMRGKKTTIDRAIYDEIVNKKKSREQRDYCFEALGNFYKKANAFIEANDFENAISTYENLYDFVLENRESLSIHNYANYFENLMKLYRKHAPEMEKPFITGCLTTFKDDLNLNEKVKRKWEVRLNKLKNKGKDNKENIEDIESEDIIINEYTPKDITLNQRIENLKLKFKEFDFYEKDPNREFLNSPYDDIFSDQQDLLEQYHQLRDELRGLIEKGEYEESKKNYEQAIKYYEIAVGEESFLTKPYERLMIIYRKLKRKDDEVRVIKKGIENLSSLRAKQKEYLYKIAKSDYRKRKTDEYINSNKKIRYYVGVFELYNPYPVIEKWKNRLEILQDK